MPRALITHAHSDHARPGSKSYLTAEIGLHVLRGRLGSKAKIETVPYGENVTMGGVSVSFHSAGHVLGSAQIRLEHRGRVWVVSGDYKTRHDPTCAPFEPVECDCFITESTFGLPIYHWPNPAVVAHELNSWWEDNRKHSRSSVVFAYSFGKAQRLLKMLDPSIGAIYVHPSIYKMNQQYLASGVLLPECGALNEREMDSTIAGKVFNGAMIIAPPSAATTQMLSGIGEYASAFASGWMRIRGNRRRQSFEKGFVLSDHADWRELLETIRNTGAEEVIVAHGYVRPLVRYLKEKGIKARAFRGTYEYELPAIIQDAEEDQSLPADNEADDSETVELAASLLEAGELS